MYKRQIHNCGDQDSEHDGIHRFFIGKNAKVKYVEKHYGEGDGTGKRVLNPGTEVYMEENSQMEMEMVQILSLIHILPPFYSGPWEMSPMLGMISRP